MMRKVIWSPEAANDYGQNIDYLLESWSSKEAQVFIDEVTGIISLLQNHNVEFRLIGYKDVRSVTICHQISLLYRVNQNSDVEIVRLWDTRQNPEKLKRFLSE
jgi:plasmid stabilization system protein ParE